MMKKIFIILLIILFILASNLGIFFYLNSFKITDFRQYEKPKDELVINNYYEYKVSRISFYKTAAVNGQITISYQDYETVNITEPAVVDGQYINKSTLLGKNAGIDMISPYIGRILSIEPVDSAYLITLLNYEAIKINAIADILYAKYLILGQSYSAKINEQNVLLKLESIDYDVKMSSQLNCSFSIESQDLVEMYLFNDSVFNITLGIETFNKEVISRSASIHLNFIEEQEYRLIIKDKDGKFNYVTFICEIIGDDYIALSADNSMIDCSVCFLV